jgi:hypothetical protein
MNPQISTTHTAIKLSKDEQIIFKAVRKKTCYIKACSNNTVRVFVIRNLANMERMAYC